MAGTRRVGVTLGGERDGVMALEGRSGKGGKGMD